MPLELTWTTESAFRQHNFLVPNALLLQLHLHFSRFPHRPHATSASQSLISLPPRVPPRSRMVEVLHWRPPVLQYPIHRYRHSSTQTAANRENDRVVWMSYHIHVGCIGRNHVCGSKHEVCCIVSALDRGRSECPTSASP